MPEFVKPKFAGIDYSPVIKKVDLVDGAYYKGRCRNAIIARWNSQTQLFYHWRFKFGVRFVETIRCPEDDEIYDVFIAIEVLENPEEEIPFEWVLSFSGLKYQEICSIYDKILNCQNDFENSILETKNMTETKKMQQLHHRASLGEELSEDERKALQNWYDDLDREEDLLINKNINFADIAQIREKLNARISEVAFVASEVERIADQNEILRRENERLRELVEKRLLEKVV